jgi:hypothetical protein
MRRKMLTPEQAFRAMFIFLNAYYERTEGKSELAEVLSDIQINSHDGLPMDPAAWGDWLAAVESARQKERQAP